VGDTDLNFMGEIVPNLMNPAKALDEQAGEVIEFTPPRLAKHEPILNPSLAKLVPYVFARGSEHIPAPFWCGPLVV